MKKQKNAPLVLPREEWPYEVPENWVWTTIYNQSEILNGYAFKSENYVENGIRIIRIANVQDGYIEDEKPAYYPIDFAKEFEKYMLKENDLLISLTGNVGRAAFLTSNFLPAALNQRVACLRIRNNVPLGIKFLFNFLRREEFQHSCIKNSKGSAQLNMSTEWLKVQPIPLPPLPEQQRIVARIESLFAKLDAAAEKIRTALDQCPIRKAAILHKALTGELTKKWREENGVGMESWENRSITSLCDSLQYGTSQKSQKTGKVIVLRMGNLQNGEIDWSNLAYTDNADDIKKYKLEKGDVLFNRTNSAELVGKTSIYRGDYPAIYAGYLIKLDYHKDEITGDYLNFVLNSERARAYCQSVKSDGVNQSNINAQKIGAFEIDLPPLPEQKEIVRILDAIFEREQAAKETAERLLEQIALTKKSILARAFRGLLGTNDPKEESAEGWLEGTIMEI